MFKKGINSFMGFTRSFEASQTILNVWVDFVWISFAMSDDEHVVIEPPRDSSRGKPQGKSNNYEAFEDFGLFRDYLDRTLIDLKNDIKVQTLKSQTKVPTFRLTSTEFSLNLIQKF